MAYVVLARKYRPQAFEEIVGQDPITRTLRNALMQSRVHHAYLFCGSRGVGKTTTARVLAKALNCEKGPTPDPCGRCSACVEIRDGTAVDVLEIDGASNNSVDNVREICENARYLPARGKRKVFIIDEVHMLSTSAFNALLKTLEEPPSHVSFIFATTEPHRIPPTVLSRCQRFDFRRVSDARLREHLERIVKAEKVKIEPAGLGLLARSSEGSVRDALSLLDQVVAFSGDERITEPRVAEILGVAARSSLQALAAAVLSRDAAKALAIIDEVFRSGHDLGRFAQAFLGHLRDLVVAASVRDSGPLIDGTDEERALVAEQAQQGERARWLAFFERFAVSQESILRSQTPKIVLEISVLDLLDAEPLLPLGDLLDRLSTLEQRLSSQPSALVNNPREPSPRMPAQSRPEVAKQTTAPLQKQAVAPAQSVAPRSELPSWPALVRGIEESNPSLGVLFAIAKPLRCDPDEIILGFPEGSFELTRARDRLEDLIGLVSKHLGRGVTVRIESVPAAAATPPSVHEVEQARTAADLDQRKREALEHPAIKAALDLLGGDVREVKAE